MECWVDAAHASEWNNKTASNDPNTARSRMGYIYITKIYFTVYYAIGEPIGASQPRVQWIRESNSTLIMGLWRLSSHYSLAL